MSSRMAAALDGSLFLEPPIINGFELFEVEHQLQFFRALGLVDLDQTLA